MNTIIRSGAHYIRCQSGVVDFSQDWSDDDSRQTILELEALILQLRARSDLAQTSLAPVSKQAQPLKQSGDKYRRRRHAQVA